MLWLDEQGRRAGRPAAWEPEAISTAGRGGARPRAAGIVGQLRRVRGQTPGLPRGASAGDSVELGAQRSRVCPSCVDPWPERTIEALHGVYSPFDGGWPRKLIHPSPRHRKN